MKTIILLFLLTSTTAFAGADCTGVCGQEVVSEFKNPLLESLSNITRFSGSSFPEMAAGDTRKIRNASSPKWLEAVGRFVSRKGDSNYQCSLSIIADSPEKDGVIAITAGHCVSHWVNADGSFTPTQNTVTFQSNKGKTIKRSVTQVFHAETHDADYAIVKLSSPVKKSELKPLLMAPYAYRDMLNEEDAGGGFKPFATAAGFSADTGKGQKGKVLTYDEKCYLNGGPSGKKMSYCYAYQGASGGPIAVTTNLGDYALEDWQAETRTYFVGSILGSHQGAEANRNMFTQASHYTKKIDPILAAH